MHPIDRELCPIGCVTCPLCADTIDVETGDTALEALWMHEYDCPALILAEAMVPAAA